MTDMDDFPEFESAAENPELLAAANALISEEKAPDLPDPLDGPVTLPAGYRRVKAGSDGTQFEDVKTAWVRELNGEDEERIARAKLRDDPNAFLRAIMEAGIERLGDVRPTKDDIDALIVGDQQYLLMEIARVTYGDDLHYEKFECPNCHEVFDVELSLKDDVPLKRLDKIEDASFEVRLSKDRIATVSLPTGEVGMLLAETQTNAEANTVLITNCVEEIRGPKGTQRIHGDVDAARRLGVVDRQTLVDAMGDKMPGPQYNEVKFNHEPDGCGEEIRLQIALADLFLGL